MSKLIGGTKTQWAKKWLLDNRKDMVLSARELQTEVNRGISESVWKEAKRYVRQNVLLEEQRRAAMIGLQRITVNYDAGTITEESEFFFHVYRYRVFKRLKIGDYINAQIRAGFVEVEYKRNHKLVLQKRVALKVEDAA